MLGMQGGMDVDIGEDMLVDMNDGMDVTPQILNDGVDYTLSDAFLRDVRGSTIDCGVQGDLFGSLLNAPVHVDGQQCGSGQKRRYCGTGVEGHVNEGNGRKWAGGRNGSGDEGRENERVRKAKHVCNECGKVFKRAHNLKIHGRLHSGDKPYGCPFAECDKEFRWKSSIVSHINWHRTKKGDVLPGEGDASIHKLICKGKQKAARECKKWSEVKTGETKTKMKQKAKVEVGCTGSMRSFVEDMTGLGNALETRLGDAEFDYVETGDDVTVLTPSTTESHRASPGAMKLEELETLPVFAGDAKGWEEGSAGVECAGGLSGMLLPSLSSCRLEGPDACNDAFTSFLEEHE